MATFKASAFHDTWYNRPGPSKRFRYTFWTLSLLLFVVFLASIVGPIFRFGFVILAHDEEHEDKSYHGDHIQFPDNYDEAWSFPTSNVSYMVAILRIVAFDLANERYTVSIKITDLRGSTTAENLLTRNVTVLLPELEKTATGHRDFTARKDYMPLYFSETKLFDDGNLFMYPFDHYHTALGLSIFDTTTKEAIPVIGVLEGSIPGYKIHVISHGTNFQLANPVIRLREHFLNHFEAENSVRAIPGITFEFEVERSYFTLSWSIFVIIMMWVVSIVQLCITMQFYLRGRDFNVSLMTFGAAFLFSLPAFRNTQPNIPTVGVAADALGFYYNMFFVVLAILVNIFMYLRSWKPKAPGEGDKGKDGDKKDGEKKEDVKEKEDAKAAADDKDKPADAKV